MAIFGEGGAPPQVGLGEFVYNFTGVGWTDYHLDFGEGADLLFGEGFYFIGAEDGSFNLPIAPINTVLDFEDDSVWLFFDEFFGEGGFHSFVLDEFFPGDVDGFLGIGVIAGVENFGEGFTVTQAPSIPEPATLGLLGAGLAGLGYLRRRRKTT